MTNKRHLRLLAFILPVAMLLTLAAVYTVKASSGKAPLSWDEAIIEHIPKMSGAVSTRMAEYYGLTEIKGKALRANEPSAPAAAGMDVPIATEPDCEEYEPSVAINPVDDRYVVAIHHRDWCDPKWRMAVHISEDGGQTFHVTPIKLKNRFVGDQGALPTLRYSPDGRWLYACYLSMRFVTNDIVVSRSRDNGWTWENPRVAIEGIPFGTSPDWCRLGVHRYDDTQARFVYVACTLFYPGGMDIVFSRSANYAKTFPKAGNPKIIASSPTGDPTLQGPWPIGALGSNVLVFWYDSADDGWLNGKFHIKSRLSTDNGRHWEPEVKAVCDQYFEAPYWLGPSSWYHRWWFAMMPSVHIAPNGVAMVVYTADPTSSGSDTECGNIYGVVSTGSPYTLWRRPIRIGSYPSAGKAQGYATVVTQPRLDGTYYVYVAWEDHRLSPVDNMYYHMYRARFWMDGSYLDEVKLSDKPSISDYWFLSEQIGSTSSYRTPFVVWTDRSDVTSIYDWDCDIYGDRLD